MCGVLSASAPLGLAGLCRLMDHDHLPQLWRVKRATTESTICRQGGTGQVCFQENDSTVLAQMMDDNEENGVREASLEAVGEVKGEGRWGLS